MLMNKEIFPGKAVEDEDGELVCLKPFPSMPVFFWNDPQGLKYKKAYFSVYNGKIFVPLAYEVCYGV